MKFSHSLVSLFFLVVTLLVAGCSTPQTRINKNPEAFAQLTPDQQELVKKGQVAIGFDMETVKLALGDPDRVRTRTDGNGTSEVWSYVNYKGPGDIPLYRGYYHRYSVWGDPLYPYYLNYPGRHERERFRVAFKDGRVTLIEQESTS